MTIHKIDERRIKWIIWSTTDNESESYFIWFDWLANILRHFRLRHSWKQGMWIELHSLIQYTRISSKFLYMLQCGKCLRILFHFWYCTNVLAFHIIPWLCACDNIIHLNDLLVYNRSTEMLRTEDFTSPKTTLILCELYSIYKCGIDAVSISRL